MNQIIEFNLSDFNQNISIIGPNKSGKTILGKEFMNNGFVYLCIENIDFNTNINIDCFKEKIKTKKESAIIKNILDNVNKGAKKVVLDRVLDYLNCDLKSNLIDYLKNNNVIFVNITTNIESVLFSDYLIVLNDLKVVMEGKTLSVLKEEKILRRLGFNLPFYVDMSIQLGYYNLLTGIYLGKEELVNALWK